MKTSLSPSGLRRVRLWGRLAAALALVLVAAVGALASGSPSVDARPLQTPPTSMPMRPPAGVPARPADESLTARGDTVLEFSEVQPELLGGIEALQARLVYPESAKRDSVQGRVILQFVVGTDGRAEQIVVRRALDPRLAEAAVEALHASTFAAGQQNGRAVAVRMALPITFRLPGSSDEVREPVERVQPTPAGDGTVYEFTEVQPELVGGIERLQVRLVYPESAKADGVEGRVILRFVVSAEGRTEQIEVVRPVDPRLDAAAVEAIQNSTFTPGQQDGRTVAVRMSLPVTFRVRPVVDQGSRRVRGVVRYAGVDLSRLANGSEIQAMIDALPARLDAEGVSYGDVRVEYLIDPDGTTRRFRVLTGPRNLHDAAVSIARTLRTAEDARPGAPTEGFFRLWYFAG